MNKAPDPLLQPRVICPGWSVTEIITEVTVKDRLKKEEEDYKEYKRLTSDFEVK